MVNRSFGKRVTNPTSAGVSVDNFAEASIEGEIRNIAADHLLNPSQEAWEAIRRFTDSVIGTEEVEFRLLRPLVGKSAAEVREVLLELRAVSEYGPVHDFQEPIFSADKIGISEDQRAYESQLAAAGTRYVLAFKHDRLWGEVRLTPEVSSRRESEDGFLAMLPGVAVCVEFQLVDPRDHEAALLSQQLSKVCAEFAKMAEWPLLVKALSLEGQGKDVAPALAEQWLNAGFSAIVGAPNEEHVTWLHGQAVNMIDQYWAWVNPRFVLEKDPAAGKWQLIDQA